MKHTASPTAQVAARIQEAMTAKQVGARELSRLTGISPETVRRRINGQGPFPIDDLFAISEALNMKAPNVLEGIA